jgi:hypothetical protein
MSKCVFRTDLRQRLVGNILQCIDASELFFRPCERTVNESVHMLLSHDEICVGASEKRAVMLGARVVGYIRVIDCD